MTAQCCLSRILEKPHSNGYTPEMLGSSKQLELLPPANTGTLCGPGTEPQLGFFTQMHMYVSIYMHVYTEWEQIIPCREYPHPF